MRTHYRGSEDDEGAIAGPSTRRLNLQNNWKLVLPQKRITEKGVGKPNGFSRGWKPVKILGITRRGDGRRKFFMKWEGRDCIEMVTAHEANKKCPQLVLDYYEKITKWE